MNRFLVLVVVISVVSWCTFGAIVPKKPILDGRIVGGEETTIQEFPYQVSLRYFNSHRCGGALYNRKTIISAAHCVAGVSMSRMEIRAGTSNQTGGVTRKVKNIIYHPKFNGDSLDYDISVLFVDDPFNYGETIAPISIPKQNEILKDKTIAHVSGWGATAENSAAANVLRYVKVSILNHNKCEQAYHGQMFITDNMICAGVDGGGKDACQGDSGGPMVVDGKLVGIVSWGFGCARPDFPGVYSNVAALRKWLDKVVEM